MIPPAKVHAAQRNVVQRVIEVGGPNAQGVKRKTEPGGSPESRDVQSNSTRNLSDPREGDDVSRIWHPMRGNGDEAAWFGYMGDPGDQVECRKQPARGRPYIIAIASRLATVRA